MRRRPESFNRKCVRLVRVKSLHNDSNSGSLCDFLFQDQDNRDKTKAKMETKIEKRAMKKEFTHFLDIFFQRR